jgi:hypothetical protein
MLCERDAGPADAGPAPHPRRDALPAGRPGDVGPARHSVAGQRGGGRRRPTCAAAPATSAWIPPRVLGRGGCIRLPRVRGSGRRSRSAFRDDRHLVNEYLAIRAAGTLVGAVPDLLAGEVVRAAPRQANNFHSAGGGSWATGPYRDDEANPLARGDRKSGMRERPLARSRCPSQALRPTRTQNGHVSPRPSGHGRRKPSRRKARFAGKLCCT